MNYLSKSTILMLSLNNFALAQIITNGSFENNVFIADGSAPVEISSSQSDTDSTPVITGWNIAGSPLTLMGATTDGSYSIALPPHVEGGTANSVSQSFNLSASGSHQLTLDTLFPVSRGLFAPNASAGGLATITDAANSIVTSWTFSAVQGDNMADNLSHSFTAGVGAYTLSLSSLPQFPPSPISASRTAIIVDNVAITSVPEPSAVILLALGTLTLTCRRKRAKSLI